MTEVPEDDDGKPEALLTHAFTPKRSLWRRMKNALYRAMAQREGPTLCAEDIDLPDFSQALTLTDDLLDGSLDDISKRFERSVLTRLYSAYPSTRKLAKRLGVSHTAITNKLREYGLSGKKTDEDPAV